MPAWAVDFTKVPKIPVVASLFEQGQVRGCQQRVHWRHAKTPQALRSTQIAGAALYKHVCF